MKKTVQRAFSLVELLTVISIIAILAALLLTALASAKAKSRQAACINNLRQIGLGFTGFALDHEGKYPMDVPERLGGSMEYIQSQLIENTPFSRDFRHFLALSNEVPNVKVMTCPSDRKRRIAKDYGSFTNINLSYWANTKAQTHATLSTLAGDWNVYNSGAATNDFEQVMFGRELHRRKGSVLFADGRVEITRSLAVAIQLPEDPIAVTKPPTRPATPTAGPPNARPQPTSTSAAPAVPPSPSSIQNVSPTSVPPQKKPDTIETPSTNDLSGGTLTSSVQRRSSGYRVSRVGAASDPAPVGIRGSSQTASVATPAPEGDDSEPWNTSGFRLFKAFAFLSYLISLLWALIALLILYLRSRLAQREQERAAANNVD